MASIRRQVTVVRDGYHNAFTDMVYWQDCYWVSYRKGTSHISMDGEVCLSVSEDRTRFREAARIKIPGDNRDPKLVVMTDGRLAMIFPTWVGGARNRHLQQFVSFSEDGFNWDKPVQIMEPHWWLWRVVEHGGRYYGAAYTYRDRHTGEDNVRSQEFVVSDDLLAWEVLGQTGPEPLGEAGFHFQPDGEVWMIARCTLPRTAPAFFCSSRPPYKDWESTQLDAMIHSPVTLEHNGVLYVAGRRHAPQEGDVTFPFTAPYSLGIWRVERGRVEPVLRIPATGDCAYPGFIKDPAGRICLSYYSQHAYRMGVVSEALLNSEEAPDTIRNYQGEPNTQPQNDVYFAELELP
jgi:hypothetical protein